MYCILEPFPPGWACRSNRFLFVCYCQWISLTEEIMNEARYPHKGSYVHITLSPMVGALGALDKHKIRHVCTRPVISCAVHLHICNSSEHLLVARCEAPSVVDPFEGASNPACGVTPHSSFRLRHQRRPASNFNSTCQNSFTSLISSRSVCPLFRERKYQFFCFRLPQATPAVTQ